MHLTIFLVKSIGFDGGMFGGSWFWVWGRGTVLYLIVGSLYYLFCFLPYSAFS